MNTNNIEVQELNFDETIEIKGDEYNWENNAVVRAMERGFDFTQDDIDHFFGYCSLVSHH